MRIGGRGRGRERRGRRKTRAEGRVICRCLMSRNVFIIFTGCSGGRDETIIPPKSAGTS